MKRLVQIGLATTVLLAGVSAAMAAGAQPAAAPAASTSRTSFVSLIQQGYVVGSVTFLPLDAVKRMQETGTVDEVIVTLQNGQSISVCLFSAAGWYQMDDASMSNEQSCDFRTYQ